MTWIFLLMLELNRLALRPVIAEYDGRPTRVEIERPEDRPTRYIRPVR